MSVYPIRCKIRAEAGVTRIDVYDDIGAGGFFSEGLSPKDFAAQLSKVKGALEVHINSGGGDVGDGIAIGNAIRSHKGPVTTVVDGMAASIASVIVQAGAERVMQPGSTMMIHDAFGMCVGDAAEMAKMAETLDFHSDNIAALYAARAGGTPEQWRALMRGEAWFTAEGAVEAGLADRVGDGQAVMPAGLDVAAMIPGRIAARLRGAAPMLLSAMHGDHARLDPDNDGDCDACPDGDTDHDYWSAAGKQIKKLPGQAQDAAGRGLRPRNAMPDAVRAKFKRDLKTQPVHEIGAAIHRLAEWSASGHYPAGMTHADIQWMYGQCSKALKKRNPDSGAGGNLPPHSALPMRPANCHFLVEATTATAAAAGKKNHADPGFTVDPAEIRKALEEGLR